MSQLDPRSASGVQPKIGPSIRSILTINLKLLHAFVLGGVAWLMWPETKECWRFGVLAVLLGAASISFAIGALVEIWGIIFRDRDVHKFTETGRSPESDQLAGDESMNDGEMF